MRAPGKIEPVIYFRCYDPSLANPSRPRGYLLIAPYTACPTPFGYEQCAAETLADVDKLEAALVQQEREGWEQEAEIDEMKFSEARNAVRDRLYARMTSAATDEWEKEFIRLYLQLRDERKKEMYRQRFLERQAYLWARHNDTPAGRQVDEEKVSEHVEGFGKQV